MSGGEGSPQAASSGAEGLLGPEGDIHSFIHSFMFILTVTDYGPGRG